MRHIARIRRHCDLKRVSHGFHAWEILNWNYKPFKRGRVVFICNGKVTA